MKRGNGGLARFCEHIVHVEGTVTRSAPAVTVSVSAEMVFTVAAGCGGWWLGRG